MDSTNWLAKPRSGCQNYFVKVSIIVPAFNEERLLGDSLAQMKNAAKAFVSSGWEWELIVCDNNSTDRTAEIARAAGAKVVFEPMNQIARARNAGAAVASGDWFIFVDADSHPSFELFADVATTIQSGKYLGGGVTLRMDKKYLASRLLLPLWNLNSRLRRWVAGPFIFIEAATFREIGGFKEKLYLTEDIALSYDMKKLSRKTGKRVAILHRHPLMTSARKLWLYTPREHLRFVLRAIFKRRETLASPEGTHIWYDGRR